LKKLDTSIGHYQLVSVVMGRVSGVKDTARILSTFKLAVGVDPVPGVRQVGGVPRIDDVKDAPSGEGTKKLHSRARRD
jgi:hypothetical protein